MPPSAPKKPLPDWVWKVLVGLLLIACALPILLYGYQGAFSRYMADDFATANTLRSMGFLPMQVYWYTHWSGRFMFYLLIGIAGALGNGIVPYFPAVLLLLLLYTISQIFTTVFRFFHSRDHQLAGGFLGVLIVGAAFSRTPTIVQSLFWQTGAVTYVLPVVFFFLFLLLLVRRYTSGQTTSLRGFLFNLAAAFLLAVFSAGLSESFLGPQLGVLTALLALAALTRKSQRSQKVLPLLGSALAGSVVAAALVVLAPGNAVRQATMIPPSSIPYAVKSAVLYTGKYLLYTFSNYSAYGVLVLVGAVLASFFLLNIPKPAFPLKWFAAGIVLAPIFGALLWVAVNIPAFYAMYSPPPDRVIIIHHFIFCFTVVLTGLLVGVLLRWFGPNLPSRLPVRIAAILLLGLLIYLAPVQSFLKASKQTPIMQQFAQEWDARDQALRQANQQGQADAVAPKVINISELDDITPDPQNAWNRFIADYYQLSSVRILP